MNDRQPHLTVELMSSPEARTIVLAGEVDLMSAATVEAAVAEACAAEPGRIVVDLRGLTFIDSSGLQALVAGHQKCVACGHELRIVPGPANVRRLFELTGMNEVLPFCDAEPGAP